MERALTPLPYEGESSQARQGSQTRGLPTGDCHWFEGLGWSESLRGLGEGFSYTHGKQGQTRPPLSILLGFTLASRLLPGVARPPEGAGMRVQAGLSFGGCPDAAIVITRPS